MALKTYPFDAAQILDTPEALSAFFEEAIAEAIEEGDASILTTALGTMARARGMSQTAREAGVTREALYKALGENGDPRLSTLLGVLKALGIRPGATGSKVI